MKKIIFSLICLIVFLFLSSCGIKKDMTDQIVPYFTNGAVFNAGLEFDDLSAKAKVSIGDEVIFKITSEGNIYGTELKYTEGICKIKYNGMEFSRHADENDPFYIITQAFEFLAMCQYNKNDAQISEFDGSPKYIFDLSDGDVKVRLIADKAACVPYLAQIYLNEKKISVYFHE